jgi:hypothetical protein
MTRRLLAVGASAVVLASCTTGEDPPAPISAATYREYVGVGSLEGAPAADLDDIGRSACSDMRAADNDETRRAVWVLLDEVAGDGTAALLMVLAIVNRFCPEYAGLWDADVDEFLGGRLPWESS